MDKQRTDTDRALDFCTEKLQKLGLNREGNKFELCFEKSSSVSVEVQDGKVDTLTQSTDQGLAIRTLKDGKMGFSYTFDLSNASLDKAITTALEISELMKADENNVLGTFSNSNYPVLRDHDTEGLAISLDDKIKMALELEAATKAYDPRIKRVRGSGFDQGDGTVILVDSSGKKINHSSSYFAVNVSCVAEDADGSAEMGGDGEYMHFLKDLNPGKVSHLAAKNALELLGSTKASTMKCPAVLKSSVAAQLMGFLTSSFSAENIDKNFSLLAGKLGTKLFSDKITLINDGILPNGIASAPFDAEGTPCLTTPLIENGVIRNFLYDNYYAKKAGTHSTGSSKRGSLKSAPSIGASNLILQKGSLSFDELTAKAGQGIYITQVMGLHTANPITGEFSFGASGILIENGKLTRPVKGFAIAGNLIELLNNVAQVGADFRFYGSTGVSSLLISELSIGGA